MNPEQVNTDPRGIRRYGILRMLDKIGMYSILPVFVCLLVYLYYNNTLFESLLYVIAFIVIVIVMGVTHLILDIICSSYFEDRSNICLDCGHIYEPSNEG